MGCEEDAVKTESLCTFTHVPSAKMCNYTILAIRIVVKMQPMTSGNVSQNHETLHDILILICIASQLLLHLLSFLLSNPSALTIVLVYPMTT
jgi:hypothetical protein